MRVTHVFAGHLSWPVSVEGSEDEILDPELFMIGSCDVFSHELRKAVATYWRRRVLQSTFRGWKDVCPLENHRRRETDHHRAGSDGCIPQVEVHHRVISKALSRCFMKVSYAANLCR